MWWRRLERWADEGRTRSVHDDERCSFRRLMSGGQGKSWQCELKENQLSQAGELCVETAGWKHMLTEHMRFGKLRRNPYRVSCKKKSEGDNNVKSNIDWNDYGWIEGEKGEGKDKH